MQKILLSFLTLSTYVLLAACSNESPEQAKAMSEQNKVTSEQTKAASESEQIKATVTIEAYLENQNKNNAIAKPASNQEDLNPSPENTTIVSNLINQHLSTYFAKHYQHNSDDKNAVVVTSPLINILPLFMLSTAGETRDEVEKQIPTFSIPASLQAQNKYGWEHGTIVNRDFLDQVKSIIKPLMEISFPQSNDHPKAVLMAESSYNKQAVFAEHNLEIKPIRGRYIEKGSAYETDMIQFKGRVSEAIAEHYSAKQIEIGSKNTLLTLITPNDGEFITVISDLNAVIGNLLGSNNGFVADPDSPLTLPVVTVANSNNAFSWASATEIPLAFSEINANLTQMGHSGFYFNESMYGSQKFEIHKENITLNAHHSIYINKSIENANFSNVKFNFNGDLYYVAPHLGSPAGAGAFLSTYKPPILVEPFEPDFKPCILLMHNHEGLIQAIAVIREINGNYIGKIASSSGGE